MVDKILHRKLNSNEHKPHLKFGVKSGAPEGQDVPAPLEAFIMLRFRNRKQVRKGCDCDYDKRNIIMVICDRCIPKRLTKIWNVT